MGGLWSRPSERAEAVPEPPESPKHQSLVPLVLCYSYIGTGYHGLQQNFDEKTIERDLFQALIACHLIPPHAPRSLGLVRWSEASRTDAGVHSCAQILSFSARFGTGMKGRRVAQAINENLPSGSPIRVWSAISVGRVFNAQRFAEYRRYKYLLPVDALGGCALDSLHDEVLVRFEGTHNFHNYTKRVSATNPSARRTITAFTVSPEFRVGGRAFVLFAIRGNSFMMNQIRKMVAVVVATARGLLDPTRIEASFGQEKWAIPKLPGEGLMLERVEYPGFRARAAQRQEFAAAAKDVEFETVRPDIEQWKREVLFPHIADMVARERTFETWIENVLAPFPPMAAVEMTALKHARGFA